MTEEVWEASSGLRARRGERVNGLGQLVAVDEWERPTSAARLDDGLGNLAHADPLAGAGRRRCRTRLVR